MLPWFLQVHHSAGVLENEISSLLKLGHVVLLFHTIVCVCLCIYVYVYVEIVYDLCICVVDMCVHDLLVHLVWYVCKSILSEKVGWI